MGDIGRMQWSRLRTHGQPPSGRFGHTLVLSEDDAILFGGWSGTQKEMAPGVAFSLKDKMRGADGTDTQEDESCDYCMTLRTSDMTWVQNKYIGVAAPKRYGHTATAIGPHLIVTGGWDGGKPLNDVVVLRDRSVSDRAADPFDGPGLENPAEVAANFDQDPTQMYGDEDYDDFGED